MTFDNKNKMLFGDLHYIDDNDAPWIIDGILKEKTILKFLKLFNIEIDVRQVAEKLTSVKTVTELQTEILVPIFADIFKNTTSGITCTNIELISRQRSEVFVSNHRDIVLDSAVMNMMLFLNGYRFANAGIGDNLLMNDTIQLVFNMMKCFVIKRSLPPKQQVLFLRNLSEFINHCVTEKGESIWIAQSSGRAKDGNDKTNPAILNMLAKSNREDPIGQLKALNIHTVACSYEWDPCDVYKVNELLAVELCGTYTKKPGEDMMSIHAGICKHKGRVHVAFNRLSDESLESLRALNERERFVQCARIMDLKIRGDYCLWPSNYIAADLLQKNDVRSDRYTVEEKEFFLERMNKRLSGFKTEMLDSARKIFLTMYANPVLNKPE